MRTITTNGQEDLNWLIDCINEFSEATRREAGENDKEYPQLHWLPVGIEPLSESAIVEVANNWFRVFLSSSDAALFADAINSLVTPATPTIEAISDGTEVKADIVFLGDVDAKSALTAWGALLLLETAAAIGSERFGICTGDDCVDVYVDRSPRHNRRFCSEICQTRSRVRRFRNR